jgi:hypothetical protein
VVTRAGLTQHDFDCEFESAEECYLAAFDHGLARIAQTLVAAVQSEESWCSRVRMGLRAMLDFLDREPAWARLLLVETPGEGQRAVVRRQHALDSLTRLLHRETSRAGAEANSALSRELTAELVVGGVFSVVRTRLLRERQHPLIDLTPSLMSAVLLPYLGPRAAGAELVRIDEPVQRAQTGPSARTQRTRTTRRTVLVLRAIAASPHSSNRDVAAAAGLSDEGQTSKLLRRLQRQGLVENVGLGQTHGEPNAWLLTRDGVQVVQRLDPRRADDAPEKPKSSPSTLPSVNVQRPGASSQAASVTPSGRGRAACQR